MELFKPQSRSPSGVNARRDIWFCFFSSPIKYIELLSHTICSQAPLNRISPSEVQEAMKFETWPLWYPCMPYVK
jgi:hypothetical protein